MGCFLKNIPIQSSCILCSQKCKFSTSFRFGTAKFHILDYHYLRVGSALQLTICFSLPPDWSREYHVNSHWLEDLYYVAFFPSMGPNKANNLWNERGPFLRPSSICCTFFALLVTRALLVSVTAARCTSFQKKS